MGLFDRFKKQAKDVVEEEIAVEEGSIEAERALIKRRKLLEAIEKAKLTAPPPPPPPPSPSIISFGVSSTGPTLSPDGGMEMPPREA